MKTGKGFLIGLLLLLGLGLASMNAVATELGDLCWLTAKGGLMRFSITQSGVGHYTYTGFFDDGDGAYYALIGEVEETAGSISGNFSGSKTTASYFRTGIFLVTLSPNLSGNVTGIRQTYPLSNGVDVGGSVVTDYHTTTVTPTTCP